MPDNKIVVEGYLATAAWDSLPDHGILALPNNTNFGSLYPESELHYIYGERPKQHCKHVRITVEVIE